MAARYRAFRFSHPDLDVREEVSGLQIAHTGGIGMVSGAASVRQAILLLLTTAPGERVMRPTYGCELFRIAFSPNDDTTAGLAIHYVRRALEMWEPRIDILRIDANPNPEIEGRLDVCLDYRLRSTREQDGFILQFDLNAPKF